MSIKVIDNTATCGQLKQMFKASGLKATDIQNALQLNSVQSVYKWTNPKNKTIPSLDNLVQLADMMDCSIDDLLVLREI